MAKPCPSGKDFPLGLKLIIERSHLHFGSHLAAVHIAAVQVDFGNHLAAVHVAAVQVDFGNHLAAVHVAA
ncbi:MAG: hypothetical protein WBO26_19735, partial [Providencia rettgeri]